MTSATWLVYNQKSGTILQVWYQDPSVDPAFTRHLPRGAVVKEFSMTKAQQAIVGQLRVVGGRLINGSIHGRVS